MVRCAVRASKRWAAKDQATLTLSPPVSREKGDRHEWRHLKDSACRLDRTMSFGFLSSADYADFADWGMGPRNLCHRRNPWSPLETADRNLSLSYDQRNRPDRSRNRHSWRSPFPFLWPPCSDGLHRYAKRPRLSRQDDSRDVPR